MSIRNQEPCWLSSTIFGACSLLMVLSVVVSSTPYCAQGPRYVLGEVLIKFRAGSDASAALARASRATPPDLDALAPIASTLSERMQTPLRVKQLSGGDWVVLTVDLDRLAEQAAAKLRARPGVAAVQRNPGESSGVGNPLTPVLGVTFKPSTAEAKAMEEAISGASAEKLGLVGKELGSYLSVPLSVKAEKADQASVRIDLLGLTSSLEERLRGQANLIEATQLNYVMDLR